MVPMTPPAEYRMMSMKNDAQCDPLPDHAQEDEHVGCHDGGEQLEEVLDPQVHHPEAPELGDSDMGTGARHHPTA